MLQVAQQMDEAAAAVRRQWDRQPRVGIIFGSGIGELADEIAAEATIDYADIPHFPRVSALGHRGRLVCGELAGLPVAGFQGRFHLYEGYSPQQTAMPVRLLQALGTEVLIASNAAGGSNPAYAVGDLMLIDDQINFMFANPLVGINHDGLGPRFPDMSTPYDRQLQTVAAAIARREDFVLYRGVYVAMLGPTYETRAEYRMVRRLGGDAVGMSTVPEVLAARHAGMRVLGLSTITNVGSPDSLSETTGHHVLTAASSAAERLKKIIHGVVASLAD